MAIEADDEPRLPSGWVTDWLIRKGLTRGSVGSLIDGFCRRITEAGIPLWRLNYIVQTLHPLNRAALYRWRIDEQKILSFAPPRHGRTAVDRFAASPFKVVFETGQEIRRRLEGPDVVLDFPILPDLIKDGFTDYIVYPIRFSDGQVNAIACATQRPGGFSDWDLDELRRAIRALAGPLEVMQMRELSRTLLDVYLGRNTGHRVLDGVIERGSGETINAVIWFCDLWNFTGISENLRTDWTIAVLNDYFEAVGEPVEEQDGEILKFIGDAILAIFPLKNLVAAEVAGRALKAASAARQRMAELNQRRAGEGKPPLDFGLSLHVGDVIYGNIGAPKRLDFTVIGPAVNMVTRIEGLTKELKQPILVSRDFAALAGAENFASQGTFELKGIEGKREVLAPRRLPDPPARPTSQVTFNSVV